MNASRFVILESICDRGICYTWDFYPSFSQSKNQLMDEFQSYEQQCYVVCRSNSLCANTISPKGNIRSEIAIYAPTSFIWKDELLQK